MNLNLGSTRILFCPTLIFLFPLGMASVRHYSSLLFVIMILCGLWAFSVDHERLPVPSLWIVGAFSVFLAMISLSLFNTEDLNQGLSVLVRMGYVLALPPLYKFIKKDSSCALKAFSWGLVFAGPVNLTIVLYSVYVQNSPRGMGYYNPIIFGDLMMLGAMLLAAFILAGFFKCRFHVMLACGSILNLLISSYLSGTRGAWAAFPFALAVAFILFRKGLNRRRILQIFVVFSLFAIIVFSVLKFGERTGSRSLDLAQITKNVLLFTQGKSSNNSTGQRFVMWGVALDMFKANPWLGSGPGGFKDEAEQQITEKNVALVKAFPHAHSIYFEFLGTTGLLGFLTMITSFFIVPGLVFRKALSGSEMQRLSASVGLVFLTCFALFGLTEYWLYRSPMLITYLLCLSVFTAGCIEKDVA